MCAVPTQLKGTAVKSLKKKDYHCSESGVTPMFSPSSYYCSSFNARDGSRNSSGSDFEFH